MVSVSVMGCCPSLGEVVTLLPRLRGAVVTLPWVRDQAVVDSPPAVEAPFLRGRRPPARLRASSLSVNMWAGCCVGALDVRLNLAELDAPLAPAADLDCSQLAGPHQRVGLRGGDREHLRHLAQRDEPSTENRVRWGRGVHVPSEAG